MAGSKTVLIIDDEHDAVDITKTMLSQMQGLDTISANDGETGIAKAREARPDLIVLDVQMPGKGGFQVFNELRADETLKNIPVIMLTGVARKAGISFSAEDMKEFLGREPEAYIEKPVDASEFQKAVSKALGLG
jgi:two-component system phosphate regulon response regulator PhoB